MIHLIFGEEEYLMDRAAREICSAIPTPTHIQKFEGKSITWGEIMRRLGEVPMWDDLTPPTRILLVDNAETLKVPTKTPIVEFEGVLILLVRKTRIPKALEALSKHARTHEFQEFKTYSNNNQVIRWIKSEGESMGLQWDANVPGLIYRMVGRDLYTIANDLEKIRVVCGTQRKLTLNEILPCLTTGCGVDPQNIIDAAIEKDLQKTFNLLTLLYKTSSEDPSMGILYCLSAQLERLLVARHMVSKTPSATSDEIASRLGMNVWVFKTNLLPKVTQHENETLVRAYMETALLDRTLKGPDAHYGRTLIENILYGICKGFG